MDKTWKTDEDLDTELAKWADRSSADWVRDWYRKQAIALIKHFQSGTEVRGKIEGFMHVKWEQTELAAHYCVAQIDLLKVFFNITEEDLK